MLDCKTTGSSKALKARLAKLRKQCKDSNVQKAGQLKTDAARKAEITRVCKSCNKPKKPSSSGKAPAKISTDIKVKLAENCDKTAKNPPRLTIAELRELLGANVVKGDKWYSKSVKLACDRKIKPDKQKIKVVGSRDEVFYGYAQRTAGGLVENDLMWNSTKTKIVSVKASKKATARAKSYKDKYGVSQMDTLKAMAEEHKKYPNRKKWKVQMLTVPSDDPEKNEDKEFASKDEAKKNKAAVVEFKPKPAKKKTAKKKTAKKTPTKTKKNNKK